MWTGVHIRPFIGYSVLYVLHISAFSFSSKHCFRELFPPIALFPFFKITLVSTNHSSSAPASADVNGVCTFNFFLPFFCTTFVFFLSPFFFCQLKRTTWCFYPSFFSHSIPFHPIQFPAVLRVIFCARITLTRHPFHPHLIRHIQKRRCRLTATPTMVSSLGTTFSLC